MTQGKKKKELHKTLFRISEKKWENGKKKKHFSPAVIGSPSLVRAQADVMWHSAAQTAGERGTAGTVCSRFWIFFSFLCKNSPRRTERPYHWRGLKRRGDERQMQPTLKWKRGQKRGGGRPAHVGSRVWMERRRGGGGGTRKCTPAIFTALRSQRGVGVRGTFFRNLTLRMLIRDPQVQRHTHTQTKTLYTLTHSPRGRGRGRRESSAWLQHTLFTLSPLSLPL